MVHVECTGEIHRGTGAPRGLLQHRGLQWALDVGREDVDSWRGVATGWDYGWVKHHVMEILKHHMIWIYDMILDLIGIYIYREREIWID